jgi:Transmembrane domain of unknown function (DUF3566)
MTEAGDNAPTAPRRRFGVPSSSSQTTTAAKTTTAGPAGGAAATAQSPTQEIARPGGGSATPGYDETGTFPVPPGPVTVPSEADRAKAEKARQKAAARSARRERARRPRQTRRAKLRLTRVDPWSVTKTAFLLSIAFGVMCVVAVFLIFSIMDASGLWDKVNETIQSVVNQDRTDQFNIKDYVAMSRVMGLTMLISVIDVVLFTALATLAAFIYNMSAAMLGGVEVTLAEDLD